VKKPALLLFDEPLSNPDARLRLTMRGEIKHLQQDLGITSIYVTHDQVEAITMADRVAVMNLGHLQAFDTPEALYDRPRTLFVASFIGNPPMNFIDVDVSGSGGKFTARAENFALAVPGERGEKAAAHPGGVIMGIRPEDISIAPDGDLRGEVYMVEPMGRENLIDVRVGAHSFLLLTDTDTNPTPGESIKLAFNVENVQFFDPQTEQSLLWG
jgi:inositol-phosphate transport system ATP-binding protein